jgi:Derlin-2/3
LRELSALNFCGFDGGFWTLHTLPFYTCCSLHLLVNCHVTVADGVIQLLGGIYLNGIMLLSPLTLALAYTYAQENPNRQLSYFIITFSAKWLPYAMLAMTFVMSSPQEALLQATGLVAAHAYDFLTKIWPDYGGGRRWINTPQIFNQWLAKPAGTAQHRSFGTAYAGRPAAAPGGSQQQQGGSGGGWASGFSGGSGAWNSRGPGRRLGGD